MTKAARSASNRSLIRRTYLRTMLITTGLSLLITLGVISGLLLQNGSSATTKMIDSLADTFVHPTPNTDAWQASSQQGPATTYVKIQYLDSTNQHHGVFYSKNARQFTQQTSHRLVAGIVSVPHHGLFFYQTRKTSRATYQVWLKLDNILQELDIVIIAVLLVALLSAGIGIFLIDLAAKRVTAPLERLTQAANQRIQDPSTRTEPLPLPQEPSEVRQLAGSFNDLLQTLTDQIKREQRFVADASHELRTPLSVIRGYISLLQRRGKQHPEVFDESLAFLDSESQRLQSLVEDLLRITRNDQLALAVEPVDLDTLVTTLITPYQAQFTVPIAYHPAPTLWVLVNPDSLKQILLALLDNARKYGQGAPVTITPTATTTSVMLRVANTGPGLSAEAQRHLFDRFYRVDDSRSSETPGSGLGLAIVQQLVTLNHGTIHVTDNVPNGVQFVMTFPRAQVKNEESSSNLQ